MHHAHHELSSGSIMLRGCFSAAGLWRWRATKEKSHKKTWGRLQKNSNNFQQNTNTKQSQSCKTTMLISHVIYLTEKVTCSWDDVCHLFKGLVIQVTLPFHLFMITQADCISGSAIILWAVCCFTGYLVINCEWSPIFSPPEAAPNSIELFVSYKKSFGKK